MKNPMLTIASFETKDDKGLIALLDEFRQNNIPFTLETLDKKSEAPRYYYQGFAPYRVKVRPDDAQNAHHHAMWLFNANSPYIELSEEELEELALASCEADEYDDATQLPAADIYVETTWEKILQGPSVQSFVRDGLRCPISAPLVAWIDANLHWVSNQLFDPSHRPTVRLEDWSRLPFEGDLEDANRVLCKVLDDMKLPAQPDELELYFLYSAEILGCYHFDGQKHQIGIEARTVWDRPDLITTLAHELCHYHLLGLQGQEDADELLTDLLVVAHGYGLLLGNNSFVNEQEGHVIGTWAHMKWRVGPKTYLPRPMIAFALALIEYRRNPNEYPDWYDQIDRYWADDFADSWEYIAAFEGEFKYLKGR